MRPAPLLTQVIGNSHRVLEWLRSRATMTCLTWRTMIAALACGALSLAGCGREPDTAAPPLPDVETANAAAQAWRAKHEADYRRDFVSIAGLHALKPGRNTAGSATGNDIVLPASTPAKLGQFTLEGERVRFE